MLKTGIQWESLPQEMSCGSGMTCWRRLRDWQHAGVWDRLQAFILAKLNALHALDCSRAVMDASLPGGVASTRALGSGGTAG